MLPEIIVGQPGILLSYMFSKTFYTRKHLLRTYSVLGTNFGAGVNSLNKMDKASTPRVHTFR